VAEEKKPDFDPDKTIVDVRRPKPPAEDADRTMVAPASRPQPPKPAEPDEQRTMVINRLQPSAGPDSDRTVIAPRAGGAVDPGDRTIVGRAASGAAAATAGGGDFQMVCLSGQARGRRFSLDAKEVLIGSGSNCQIQFPGIDSEHVKLVRHPDGYEMQNIGRAGSVVLSGGRKPSRAKLKSGDLLKVGDLVLRYAEGGEVFSSEYDEKEFQGGLGNLFAPEYRLYLGIGVALLVLAIVFLWPSARAPNVAAPKTDTSAADKTRKEEIAALLQAGEVLFNAGKLMSPADQPGAESAFAKFNEVLEREPGNEQARQWLKKIDEERDKQRHAREDAEKARLAEQRAREERARQELEKKVAVIVEQGDAYFDKGQVTEPVGTNALAKYREALKIYPESQLAQERVQKAANYYVQRGDELRDKNDLWAALEDYRKASRAADGKDEEVQKRVRELEAQLRSGMAGTSVKLVIYKDERGQLFVLDDMDKVPARYKDRAIEVLPVKGGGAGVQ
jgi:tetratricopeptide (TPR) repeat protein